MAERRRLGVTDTTVVSGHNDGVQVRKVRGVRRWRGVFETHTARRREERWLRMGMKDAKTEMEQIVFGDEVYLPVGAADAVPLLRRAARRTRGVVEVRVVDAAVEIAVRVRDTRGVQRLVVCANVSACEGGSRVELGMAGTKGDAEGRLGRVVDGIGRELERRMLRDLGYQE